MCCIHIRSVIIMVDIKNLEFEYKQNLENNIVRFLSEQKNIDLREAMDIYYRSRLAKQIESSMYGIENMDYKYLTQDLIDNEPDLF